MEFDKVIRGRRSIRKYHNREIPDNVIKELLDYARYAPSSMNGQPWHFIVVRSAQTKKRLVDLKNKYCPPEKQEFEADFIKDAAAIIFICIRCNKSYDRGVENAVLAAAHIMLGAHAKGLSSVYMSAYRANEPRVAQEIRELLNIPYDIDPVTMIPLGYPAEVPQTKKIKPLDEIISYETFSRE